MFDVSSSLFWYKLLFMLELIVSELMFTKNLRRRNRFGLRGALSCAALFALTLFFPIITYNVVYTSFLFIMLFLFTLGAMKICFDESWRNLIFCGLAAYTVQHIAFIIFSTIGDFIGICFDIRSVNPYLEELLVLNWWEQAISFSIYIGSYVTIYMTAYLAYPDKIRSDGAAKLGRTKFVVLAGIILLSDNIFNAITIYSVSINSAAYWVERAYNVFTCVLAIQLQFSQLTEKETQSTLTAVQHILREEQKQYEIIKQNLNFINVKCHDMKHQIKAIRASGSAGLATAEKELNEMENVINIYESVINTGNEALDIIITEKNLIYGKSGIQITCIADGAQLDFMSPADLYSLFGNALDNAIEAVKDLSPSKRNISLLIKSVGNMVSIRIENYFGGKVAVSNGALLTTKTDKINHGFGMLSMRTVTEKYNGTMVFDCAENIFNLNILLPNPSK